MPSSVSIKKTYVVLDFAGLPKKHHDRWESELSDPNQIVWINPNKGKEGVEKLRQADAGEAITFLLILNAIQSGWLKRACQVNRFFLSGALVEKTKSTPEINKVGGLNFPSCLYFVLRKCQSDPASWCVVVDTAKWAAVDVDQYAGVLGRFQEFQERLGTQRLTVFDHQEFGLAHLLLLDAPSKHEFGDVITTPSAHVVKHWKGFKFDFSETFHDLLRQEFVDMGVRERFVSICERTFPQKKGGLERTLHILRLCRRIVTWTLEGAPFQCTIFLADNKTYNIMSGGFGPDILPLFALKPAIPFLFEHKSDVRDLAEMIQSEGLMLHVNIDSGAMDRVLAASVGPVRGHFWQGRDLTKDNKNCMIIHMRDGHFVELYANGNLELLFDGFTWETSPYEKLEGIVIPFFNNPPMARRLNEVIASLLNQWKSSIVILLDNLDESELDNLRNNNLISPLRSRTPAQWDFQSDIKHLPAGTLEGILKLDGAHVINSDGKLLYIAQKIADDLGKPENSPGLAVESGTQSASPTSNIQQYPGTGTNAARSLSGKLKNSMIIKVSASGNLKLFKAGEPV